MIRHTINRMWYALIILLSVYGCGGTGSQNLINQKWVEGKYKKQIKKLLLLPSDIIIMEVYPGKILEESHQWSAVASSSLDKELLAQFQGAKEIDAVDISILGDYSKISNQVEFSRYVCNTIPKYTRGWSKWPHKLIQFDYSVGRGFSFLSEDGIDGVLLITGAQLNKRHRFNGAPVESHLFPKQNITFGDLFLSVSLIDVDSGDVMWSNYREYYQVDLRYPEDVGHVFSQLMAEFPRQFLTTL